SAVSEEMTFSAIEVLALGLDQIVIYEEEAVQASSHTIFLPLVVR
ncbi:MAG: hypothetical protein ACI9EW_003480, partial [Cellvibrionaceae bacterium]